MPSSILVVEDEKNTRDGLVRALGDEYEVYEARDAQEAFRLMESEVFDVVLTDLRMAGKSGMYVIDKALGLPNKPICIMMTAYGSVETAVEAMKRGAYDFLTKPVSLEKLEILIKRGLRSKSLEEENVELYQRLDEKYSFEGMIGSSPALKRALADVKQVARSTATVLLHGETGTGKELFAQMIHQHSKRSRKPFIAVHCAALSSNLLESELFGHEKGSFTGATETRAGRFEMANSGTLFLDEIGEIDASTQVKLLRFLESKTFERVGSSVPITVDVRLVCATNRDLEAMVRNGSFREDLFYRLNVVTVSLPSLREREEDIPVLVEYYIDKFSKENGVESARVSVDGMEALKRYSWPGNIRELRNFCENLVVMKPGRRITEFDLDPKFTGEVISIKKSPKRTIEKKYGKEDNEKRLVAEALKQACGNRTEAARLLGISRRTLHRRLDKWPELEELK